MAADRKMSGVDDAQFKKASDAGRRLLARGPLALSARYAAKRIQVELNNGCTFAFPVEHAEDLAGAKVADLKIIKIEAAGLGLHWPRLDADLYVPSLIKGVLGSKLWMAHIGAMGGSATSSAKAASSRVNGAQGGRPRRQPVI